MITTEFFDTVTLYDNSVNEMAFAVRETAPVKDVIEETETPNEVETESEEVIEDNEVVE